MELLKQLMDDEFIQEATIMEGPQDAWAKKLAAKFKAEKKLSQEKQRALKEKAKAAEKEARAKAKEDEKKFYVTLSRMIQDAVSSYIPDSDGYDSVYSKLRKQGVPSFEIPDMINKACKLHLDCNTYFDYVDQVLSDLRADGLLDADNRVKGMEDDGDDLGGEPEDKNIRGSLPRKPGQPR